MTRWAVNVRDADRRLIGQVDDYDELEIILRFNLPGSWAVSGINLDNLVAAASTPAAGVVIDLDDVPILSGPWTTRRRERVTDDGFVRNLLTVAGADDLVWLWRRKAHASPADGDFSTQSHDVRTGAAETIMHEYVDANAGPSALSWRRVDGLTLAADTALGTTLTERARMQALGDFLASIAIKGGGLGFKVVQDGADLVFSVYEPVDRSSTVELSDDVGNLGDFAYEIRAPESNAGWVGGADELTARTFVHRSDPASISTWGRSEFFRNRTDTDDVTELAKEGDEELEVAGAQTVLEVGAVDLANLSFGVDYGLGDQVTAVIDDVEVVQVIREVRITVTADGEDIVPVLGTPGGTAGFVADVFDRLKRLDRRVTTVERR